MIPIFRGKKIGLNNSYIIGFYQQYIEGFQDNIFHEINNTLIDPTTLAIHFPNMLDSQGNKIFASLSENGKGGDILKTRGNKAPCKFNKGFTIETIMGISNLYMLLDKVEIIGIQE